MIIKTKSISKKNNEFVEFKKEMKRNGTLYLLVLPVIIFYLIFAYKPMYGALIAFQNYSVGKGFLGSEWVGFEHFKNFFNSPDFIRVLSNTLRINIVNLIFGFPMPIILALMLNEVRNNRFKKIAQTVTYLPHFISLVVICALIRDFVGKDGVITTFFSLLGFENTNMLNNKNLFTPIYVISDIWQTIGWNSIIYLAALTGVDTQLYEAASLDGAGKWRQLIHVTIPGIMPTVITMLILKIGSLMGLGYEKIILLYNPLIYETSDVISSYVYRLAFSGQQWSYTTAIGLFNSIVNLILLISVNKISKKVADTSLW